MVKYRYFKEYQTNYYSEYQTLVLYLPKKVLKSTIISEDKINKKNMIVGIDFHCEAKIMKVQLKRLWVKTLVEGLF